MLLCLGVRFSLLRVLSLGTGTSVFTKHSCEQLKGGVHAFWAGQFGTATLQRLMDEMLADSVQVQNHIID
jgi:hypothetical protein